MTADLITALAIERQNWICENWDYELSYISNITQLHKDMPQLKGVNDMVHCHYYFHEYGTCNLCPLDGKDCTKYFEPWIEKVDRRENASDEAESMLLFLKGELK